MQQYNPKKFKKFKKIPLILAAVFLALAGLALFYLWQEFMSNKKLAAEARAEEQARLARGYEMKTLQIFMKNTVEQRVILNSHFAESKNVVPFLDAVEELGRKVGAKPEVVSVETPKGTDGLLVTLKALGSFESLYKFLELLENSPYELEFVSVDLTKQTSESGSIWQAQWKIKLLSFLP